MTQVRPDRVADIYDRWDKAGRPYRDHRNYGTIQDMGVPPEDYCCLTCGATWEMGMGSTPPPPRGGEN